MDLGKSMKDAVEKLDLERRLEVASEQGRKAVHRAVESAGEFAHEHRGDITGMLDKAGDAIDQRTKGKYAGQVGKVKDTVTRGVEKVAERRPPQGPPAPPPPAPPAGPPPPAGPG